MSRRDKFFPGWKMTWNQHAAYFRLLEAAARAQGKRTPADKEELRQAIHARAFGRTVSAKEIDHLIMFDAYKAECMALSSPADLEAQLHQAEQPLIRLRHGILEKFSPDRILGLLRSARFKRRSLDDLNDMSEGELEQLRNTLCARTAGEVQSESDLVGENDAFRVPF